MPWLIEGFDLDGDALREEYEVDPIDVDVLRRVYGLSPDDPGYDCYPLDEARARELGLRLPDAVDLESLNWFLGFMTSD